MVFDMILGAFYFVLCGRWPHRQSLNYCTLFYGISVRCLFFRSFRSRYADPPSLKIVAPGAMWRSVLWWIIDFFTSIHYRINYWYFVIYQRAPKSKSSFPCLGCPCYISPSFQISTVPWKRLWRTWRWNYSSNCSLMQLVQFAVIVPYATPPNLAHRYKELLSGYD